MRETDFIAILHVPLSCDKFSAIYSRDRVQAIQRQHRFPAQIGIVTSYTKTSDMFNVTTINNIHDQL